MEKDKEEAEKMKPKNEVTFLIKVMNGGGAERVISLLSGALVKKEYMVNLIVTHQKKADAYLRDIDESIKVIFLEEKIPELSEKKLGAEIRMLYARFLGKVSKVVKGRESDRALIQKYYARNYKKIIWLKEYFKMHNTSTVIAFLYDSIFLTLLSTTNSNKVIISERGDPQQSIGSKTTMAFLHSAFSKADNIVFQSPDVQKWYFDNMQVEGQVIFNPVKPDLPERFEGVRKKKIVNFCRISEQKNLELLVNAFGRLQKEYREYELYIYGDAVGNGAEGYVEKINIIIDSLGLTDVVHILPGRSDIHSVIRDYAMFVSSSDFEGMSNSMIEAMAIGLPVVCTDCPAGGARAVINDHENGLLVPVRDVEKLYLATKEVVENPELAEKLSKNGSEIRNELAVGNIIEKWKEIIDD